jgi:hypothetical protein
MDADNPKRISRRAALKWVGAAMAAYPLLRGQVLAIGGGRIKHTLTDPDLLNPGKLWDRVLTKDELRTIAALCDVIIPADDTSPAASEVGIADFFDEWVSAPYPVQEADRKLVRDGLVWLNAESQRRFQHEFAALTDEQKTKICNDICFAPKAKAEFKDAAAFFARMRDLTASGFYTTKEGMNDLQYIGNVPLFSFDGPPRKVLEYLKLV